MYVKNIKMIIHIDNLLCEMPMDESFDELVEKLLDTRDRLLAEIKAYRRSGATRAIRLCRRTQIITACRILHKSYYELMH